MSDEPKDDRPTFQLSLRAILLIVAGFAAVLAVWRWSPDVGLIVGAGYGSLLLVAFAFSYGGWPARAIALIAAFFFCSMAWSIATDRMWISGDKVLPVHITVRDRVSQRPVSGAHVHFCGLGGPPIDSATSDSRGLAICQARFTTDGCVCWRFDHRWAMTYGEIAIAADRYRPFRRTLDDLGAQPWDYRDGPLELVIELEPE